jgi:hypothetical protein
MCGQAEFLASFTQSLAQCWRVDDLVQHALPAVDLFSQTKQIIGFGSIGSNTVRLQSLFERAGLVDNFFEVQVFANSAWVERERVA